MSQLDNNMTDNNQLNYSEKNEDNNAMQYTMGDIDIDATLSHEDYTSPAFILRHSNINITSIYPDYIYIV